MEDAAIVQLYWDRDQEAITASDRKYGALCRTLSRNILSSREDAEECVNDTWHRAWDTMPPQRPASLGAYLCRIVRNLSLDRWRARRAEKRGAGAEALVLELEGCVPAAPSAEAAWEARETAAAVERWLDGLAPEDRWLFLRRYWYCASIGEIAEEFHFSASKVKSMLHRTRLGLRDHLIKEGYDL